MRSIRGERKRFQAHLALFAVIEEILMEHVKWLLAFYLLRFFLGRGCRQKREQTEHHLVHGAVRY